MAERRAPFPGIVGRDRHAACADFSCSITGKGGRHFTGCGSRGVHGSGEGAAAAVRQCAGFCYRLRTGVSNAPHYFLCPSCDRFTSERELTVHRCGFLSRWYPVHPCGSTRRVLTGNGSKGSTRPATVIHRSRHSTQLLITIHCRAGCIGPAVTCAYLWFTARATPPASSTPSSMVVVHRSGPLRSPARYSCRVALPTVSRHVKKHAW